MQQKKTVCSDLNDLESEYQNEKIVKIKTQKQKRKNLPVNFARQISINENKNLTNTNQKYAIGIPKKATKCCYAVGGSMIQVQDQ